ncbi:hypothetical protein EPR50_G00061790 [Perca flavescens]|uniref:Uncharacterized protein n=1 Tax=Perca flavescens TaxID=8167 RepID=A0A484D7W5_PERFV|nr:hypothetical protein EPR50_G00061790 [Perca flavescens]
MERQSSQEKDHMASNTVAGCTEDTMTVQTDEGVSRAKQNLEDLEDRLVTLSERITLCDRVFNGLKDLSDILVRKSLQNVSLPPQK